MEKLLILILAFCLCACQDDKATRYEKGRAKAMTGDVIAIFNMYWSDYDEKNPQISLRTKWAKVGFQKTDNPDLAALLIKHYLAYTKDIATGNKAFVELNQKNPKNSTVVSLYQALKQTHKKLDVPELDKYINCIDNELDAPGICQELSREKVKSYKDIEAIQYMFKNLPDITYGEEAE